MIKISQDLKDAGFVYREVDKNHPKYELAKKICEESYIIDMTGSEYDDEEL